MISTVTNAPQPVPAAQPTTSAAKTKPEGRSTESAQSKPQPSATDTVKLSNTALMFAQEATETPTQTRKEAMSGDSQAQRLLAKEAAAAKAAAK